MSNFKIYERERARANVKLPRYTLNKQTGIQGPCVFTSVLVCVYVKVSRRRHFLVIGSAGASDALRSRRRLRRVRDSVECPGRMLIDAFLAIDILFLYLH